MKNTIESVTKMPLPFKGEDVTKFSVLVCLTIDWLAEGTKSKHRPELYKSFKNEAISCEWAHRLSCKQAEMFKRKSLGDVISDEETRNLELSSLAYYEFLKENSLFIDHMSDSI